MDNNIVNSPVPELACPEVDRRERHQRKCAVCRHPEREAIEEAFLHWHSPNQIAIAHDLEEASIYRHAHALGLFDRRRPNFRCALENLIERVDEIQDLKPAAVVRAIQAYACMSGEWVEPPRQIVVTHFNSLEDSVSTVPSGGAGDAKTTEILPGKPDTTQIIMPKLHSSRPRRRKSRRTRNRKAKAK